MQVARLAALLHLHLCFFLARLTPDVNARSLTYIFRITYAVLCLTVGLESAVWSGSFNLSPLMFLGRLPRKLTESMTAAKSWERSWMPATSSTAFCRTRDASPPLTLLTWLVKGSPVLLVRQPTVSIPGAI